MNADLLLDRLEEIDAGLIEHAGLAAKQKNGRRAGWIAAAACLCLIIGGATMLRGKQNAGIGAREWSASMTAADYFKNSGAGRSQIATSSSSDSVVMPPEAVAVSVGDEREQLEADGVLPRMPEHQEHSFQIEYNGDGSLYKVSFWWMKRGDRSLEGYSDLKLTAAPKELHEVSDVVVIRTDESGSVIPADVTTTVRDGVTILAEGREDETKTLTWQTQQGWYQVSGSWNDSYDAVVSLMDWFWEHPLPLSRFSIAPEETIIFSDRSKQPEAFQAQIPDFAGLGYKAESELVNLGQHEGKMTPIWFEGIYTRGATRIRWTISVGADADAWAACAGRPGEVTENRLAEEIGENGFVNLFFDMPCMATLFLENGSGADAWEIVQSIPCAGN